MISPQEHKTRLQLYTEGLNDRQIGERLYLTPQAVYMWRIKNGLPANCKTGRRFDYTRRFRLYEEGCHDPEIAEVEGKTPQAICYWRKNYNLPPNSKRRGHYVI